MNFEDTDFRYEFLDPENPFDVKLVSGFLSENGYDYLSEDVDLTVILYNLNDDIIGTGSSKNQTLKYVVVADKFRESTAFPLIVSYLSDKILKDNTRCFVFTKPETSPMFEGLGFKEIARAEPLFSVLEFGYESIGDYQDELRTYKRETKTDKVAAIVVNCNPFTLGHQYLIEKAAAENEVLYLFIVEADLSIFPYDVRVKIVKEGIAHLNNVVLIPTGPYIVSGSIFPNYFLKLESPNLISEKQAEVDIRIFADYVVPVLGIRKRYVGTEVYCQTTHAYNQAMKKILPGVGCQLLEFDRKTICEDAEYGEQNCISASKVRKAMKEGRVDDMLAFLPEVTRAFLLSPDSKPIWDRLK